MDYDVVKALHIISFTAWLSALLYLPRLYVYHAGVAAGSEASETFKVMEKKLLRFIANPAMILTLVFGIVMGVQGNWFAPGQGGWLHAKLGLVLCMAAFHGACAVWRKDFAADRNRKSARFFRLVNEVPAVLLVGIVFLVVLKPF